MVIRTAADLGVAIADARIERGITQAELAASAHVSRRWIIEVEKGHPGAEIGKILRVLVELGLAFDLADAPLPAHSHLERLVLESEEW